MVHTLCRNSYCNFASPNNWFVLFIFVISKTYTYEKVWKILAKKNNVSEAGWEHTDPNFVNVYGAQELTPRNRFRHAAYVAWRPGTKTLCVVCYIRWRNRAWPP